MPINSTHQSYDSHAKKWQRGRDACAGQDAVHERGVTYLPKLKEQSDDDYAAYKLRASYFNATGRTVDGLVGLVFRKPMEINASGIDGLLADIDLKGTALDAFAQTVLRELLTVSRFGVLVEYPQVTDPVRTQAQAERLNLRPYASVYKTESIVNWRVQRVNNVMRPVMVMLKECYYDTSDQYAPKEHDQWRELLLTKDGYVQRVWHKNQRDEFVQIGADIVPLMNNKPLPYIPFFIFGCDANDFDLTDAPILPLADINIAHYRVAADYENGCHVSGLPTLFLAGLQLAADKNVYVGGSTAIVCSDPQGHGEYIEVSSKFEALSENLAQKERQMAAIGARFIEQSKSGVETAEALKIRSGGEHSVLAALASLISSQLSAMLNFMSEWYGVKGDVSVRLNTDYAPVGMSAQELTAIVQAWQAGAISYNTLFHNLKAGEIVSNETDIDAEQQDIQDNPVTFAGG